MTLIWYPRDIRVAIKGLARLTLEERGAYTSIVDHQYLMGGPLPDDDRYMSGILGCDMRVWRRLKAQLVRKERIRISNGHIADDRASNVQARLQVERSRRVASGQLGGISSGVSRQNKGLGEVPASPRSSQIREENNREDAAYAAPAASPPAPNEGLSAQEQRTNTVWSECPNKLAALGVDVKKARSLIGLWLKTHKPEVVLCAVDAAWQLRTQDPIAYVTGALKPRDPPAWRRNGGGVYVRHGSEQYKAWRKYYKIINSSKMYEFRDELGHEVSVPNMWPPVRP